MVSRLISWLLIPSPRLLFALLVTLLLVWRLGGLSLDALVESREAEGEFVAAYLAHDYERAAAAGRRRLAAEVVEPDHALLTALADSMVRAGASNEGLALAQRVLERARKIHGESSSEVALAKNNLAWFMIVAPDPSEGDLRAAKRLAESAVELAPDNPYCQGTLGTINLLIGDAHAARELLESALARHTEADARATDGVILALALARLGALDEARERFEEALVRGRPDPRFMTEAEELFSASANDVRDQASENEIEEEWLL